MATEFGHLVVIKKDGSEGGVFAISSELSFGRYV